MTASLLTSSIEKVQQFSLKLNHLTTHTDDLVILVKVCVELDTLFGRTDAREMAHTVL